MEDYEDELDFGEEELYQQQQQQHREQQQYSHDHRYEQQQQQQYSSRRDVDDEDAISIGERSVSPVSHQYYAAPSQPQQSRPKSSSTNRDSRSASTANYHGGRESGRGEITSGQNRSAARSSAVPTQPRASLSRSSSDHYHQAQIAQQQQPASSSSAVAAAGGGGSTFAPDGTRLPYGWTTKLSASSGEIYYRNDTKNMSLWDVPGEELANVREVSPPAPARTAIHPSRVALIPRGSYEGLQPAPTSHRSSSSNVTASSSQIPTGPLRPNEYNQSRRPISVSQPSDSTSRPSSQSRLSIPTGPKLDIAHLERVASAASSPASSNSAVPIGPAKLASRYIKGNPNGGAKQTAFVDATRPVLSTGADQFAPNAPNSSSSRPPVSRPVLSPGLPTGPAADARHSIASSTRSTHLPSPDSSHGPQFAPVLPSENRWATNSRTAVAPVAGPRHARTAKKMSQSMARSFRVVEEVIPDNTGFRRAANHRVDSDLREQSRVMLSSSQRETERDLDADLESYNRSRPADESSEYSPPPRRAQSPPPRSIPVGWRNSPLPPDPRSSATSVAPPIRPSPIAPTPPLRPQRPAADRIVAVDRASTRPRSPPIIPLRDRSPPPHMRARSPEPYFSRSVSNTTVPIQPLQRELTRIERARLMRPAGIVVGESSLGPGRPISPPRGPAPSMNRRLQRPAGVPISPPLAPRPWGPLVALRREPSPPAFSMRRRSRSRSPPLLLRRRSPSPRLRRRSPSPLPLRRRSPSPLPLRRRSRSRSLEIRYRRRSPSPLPLLRRRSRSPSPRRRSPSPIPIYHRRRSISPRRRSLSPRRRSFSPPPLLRRRSRSRDLSPLPMMRMRSRTRSPPPRGGLGGGRPDEYRPVYSREELSRVGRPAPPRGRSSNRASVGGGAVAMTEADARFSAREERFNKASAMMATDPRGGLQDTPLMRLLPATASSLPSRPLPANPIAASTIHAKVEKVGVKREAVGAGTGSGNGWKTTTEVSPLVKARRSDEVIVTAGKIDDGNRVNGEASSTDVRGISNARPVPPPPSHAPPPRTKSAQSVVTATATESSLLGRISAFGAAAAVVPSESTTKSVVPVKRERDEVKRGDEPEERENDDDSIEIIEVGDGVEDEVVVTTRSVRKKRAKAKK